MTHRPLVGIAASLIFGTAGGLLYSGNPSILLLVSSLAILLLVVVRLHVLKVLLVHAAIVLVSWTNATLAAGAVSKITPEQLMDRPQEFVRVIGIVTSDPVFVQHQDGFDDQWMFRLRLEALNRLGTFQHTSGSIEVRWETSDSRERKNNKRIGPETPARIIDSKVRPDTA